MATRLLFLLLLAIGVTACSTQTRTPASAPGAASGFEVVETWEYPASAYPAVCMLFGADGRLLFRGGFLFFNPSRWTRDPGAGMTDIMLGGDTPFPEPLAREQIRRRAGALVAYDAEARRLRYRLAPAEPSLEFAGLIFYRSNSCSAI